MKFNKSKKNKNESQSQGKGLKQEILIDGNTSMALGSLFSGCQFLSWYPITPASSMAETFEKFASFYQRDHSGKKEVFGFTGGR